MKRVKGKYIRLTEEQLNKIVKDSVEKQLALIMEYAEPRKRFVECAYNLSFQIAENWCLVRYCTLIGREQTKTHWKNELFAHMVNIASMKLKGNNSTESRQKAFAEAWDRADFSNDAMSIYGRTVGKFVKENIDIKDENVIISCRDCHESSDTIVSLLANGNFDAIHDYIETI